MEQITLLYTLFCLFGSIVLASCMFKDRRTWIFGVFFFIVFIGFAWLTYTEILSPVLKTDPLRAHIYRGIFSIGILTVIGYRFYKIKWRR